MIRSTTTMSRRAAALAMLALLASPAAIWAAPSGPPIRIGSTLALTGPLAADGAPAQDRGRDLRRGAEQGQRPARPPGGVGRARRPVQARPRAEPLREADHRRQGRPHDRALRHQRDPGRPWPSPSATRRSSSTTRSGCRIWPSTRCTSPSPPFGPEPNKTVPTMVFDGPRARSKPPKSIAIVTSKFPSAQFHLGRRADVAEQRGLKVALYLEYEFGTRDLGADRRAGEGRQRRSSSGSARSASTATSSSRRMKKLDYTPPRHFHLFPAPGPLAHGAGRQARAVDDQSSRSTRRSPATPAAARLIPLFHERAAKAGLPYVNVDTQAAGVVRRLAGARGGGDGDQEPRRQGDRRVAQEEPGRHDHRPASLRRAQQLRRRPLARSSRCRTASGWWCGRRSSRRRAPGCSPP